MKSEYPKYYIPNVENWGPNLICIRLNSKKSTTNFYKHHLKIDIDSWHSSALKKDISKKNLKEITKAEAVLLI